jgi:hypothetical protein
LRDVTAEARGRLAEYRRTTARYRVASTRKRMESRSAVREPGLRALKQAAQALRAAGRQNLFISTIV